MSGALVVEIAGPTVIAVAAVLARRTRDTLLLAGAALVALAAVAPPLHDLAHNSVTGHMVQHLLLIVMVAPLVGVALAGAPRRRSSGIGRRMFRLGIRPAVAPLVAGAVHVAVVIAWHHPVPYDAAVDHWLLHGVEHSTMLASGIWWWWTVAHHARRGTFGAPALSLFAVATLGAVLGVLMMFAPPLYGQGGLEDQQIAGALMAGGSGAVYMLTAVVLIARALSGSDAPRRVRIPAGSHAPAIAVVAAVAVVIGAYQARPDDAAAHASNVGTVVGDDLVDEGRELYRRDCAACHGPAGEGTEHGVPIDETGTASVLYAVSTGRMPITFSDDRIERRPSPYTDQQIAAIVRYTATFVDGPEALDVAAMLPDRAAGGEQYRLQCAACHSATGIGGTQAGGREAPSVLHATPNEIAAAVVAGPGGMPSFRAALTDQEIADVADYVQLLQDPPTTGAPIPGGRVGEGLIAWLIGIGALVAAAAWIGRRS